jgi:two-component system CheB/CheR fusion protein
VPENPTPPSLNLDVLPLLERRLLHSYAPPTVIVSDQGEIVFIHGRTGAYLEPAEGEPTNNILTMARPGLQPVLSMLMRKAAADGQEAVQQAVRMTENGGHALVDLVVRRISEPEMIRGLLMISFEEPRPAQGSLSEDKPKGKVRGRVSDLERELQLAKENLQVIVEQMETTNEELHSSNEELQSTNEELQSTNEELETSKEEMQSMNEEMQTVNAELQLKMEDLARANDDMTNLLNSTDIATIFLDNELCISRYTDAISDVIHVIPSDIGRPIGDLVSNLDYDLVQDANQVLKTLMTCETEVQAADNRTYLVRLTPYRTSENRIHGLVATFVDVTAAKAAAVYAESIVNTVRQPLLVLNDELRVVSGNEAFFHTFGVQAAEAGGQLVYELCDGQWRMPELRELLEQVLPRDSVIVDFRIEHDFPKIGRRVMLLNGRRLEQASALPGRILLALEDVTGREP